MNIGDFLYIISNKCCDCLVYTIILPNYKLGMFFGGAFSCKRSLIYPVFQAEKSPQRSGNDQPDRFRRPGNYPAVYEENFRQSGLSAEK